MDRSDPPSKTPAGGIHAGHRSRMRQRFLAGGLVGFADHEVLELLLFYAVPRRDVNPMAHMLIQRFGNLSAVLDAPEEELCAIPGVGPHIARFLNLIPKVMIQMARRQSHREEALVLRTPKDLQALLALRSPQGPVGQVLFILTDTEHRVLALHHYDSFEALSIRNLAMQITSARASLAVLAERVDDCAGFPLPGRCQALDHLSKQLTTLEAPLFDYFTVDDLGHLPRSYARTGQLLPR